MYWLSAAWNARGFKDAQEKGEESNSFDISEGSAFDQLFELLNKQGTLTLSFLVCDVITSYKIKITPTLLCLFSLQFVSVLNIKIVYNHSITKY